MKPRFRTRPVAAEFSGKPNLQRSHLSLGTIGLKAQIVWSFLITVIIILNVAAWFFYSKARDYFDTQLGETLVGLAQSGSNLIDADLLEFVGPGYERGGFYNDLQETLESLKGDFQVHRLFVIDPDLQTLLATRGDSPVAITSSHVQTNLAEVEAALNGKAVYSTLYRASDGNLYKSAYSPVLDRTGRIVAVVCVDASPAFLRVIDRITNLILTLNLVSILLAVVVSLILARSILRPVQQLVEAARRLSLGDFSRPAEVASNNEIGFLAQVFNSMQENIKAKEERLQKLKKVAEGRAESIQSYNDYILRSIEHGIVTCDLDGKITIINPAAEKILGLSRHHSAGKKYAEVFGVDHPFASFVGLALRSKSRGNKRELEIALPETQRILSTDTAPLLDSNQKTIGVSFVITDLTEIRHLQEKIREKEQLAYLGELSATIAHEVRNPLNSMELFVGLLKRRINDEAEREEAINRIQSEIKTLNIFISDFLTFARPMALKIQRTLVSKLFQEVLFLAWKELRDKKIDVRVNLRQQKLKVRGDLDQLKRALLNVVLNAIQSMKPCGTLTLAATSPTGSKTNGKMQIEISDTGRGISPGDCDKIFQPFFSRRSQGTGLGLAIVKNIINAHSGTIIVQDNQPRGTKFIFNLSGADLS